jgi:hypothetical protein
MTDARAALQTRTYALYVESGPRKRKTQVHVIELLGCTVNGPTTDEAIAAAPDAIRDFLAFLREHRERGVPPARARFDVQVAAHVMEGSWIGNGDPDPGFAPDFAPQTRADERTYLKRLEWMQAEFAETLRRVTPRQLNATPRAGRPLIQILRHVAGAHHAYLQSPLTRPPTLTTARRAVEQGPDPLGAFQQLCALARERLETTTDEERSAQVQHGAKLVTARRIYRRMLEHQWEHLVEVRERLNTAHAPWVEAVNGKASGPAGARCATRRVWLPRAL